MAKVEPTAGQEINPNAGNISISDVNEALQDPQVKQGIKTVADFLKEKLSGSGKAITISLSQENADKIALVIKDMISRNDPKFNQSVSSQMNLLSVAGYTYSDGKAVKGGVSNTMSDSNKMSTPIKIGIIGGSVVGGILLIWGISSLIKNSKKSK